MREKDKVGIKIIYVSVEIEIYLKKCMFTFQHDKKKPIKNMQIF